jgi:hypothetical protein
MLCIRRLPFISLFTASLIAGPALAAPGPAGDSLDLTVAADSLAFQYREFDADGRELNREDGTLPGIRLTARGAGRRLFARADLSFHDGDVDYDGETQRGAPFRTDTDTRLVSASVELGGWIGSRPGRWGTYLRLARCAWERDIQGRGNVQGLFEEYRWTEVGGGVRRVWPQAGTTGWRHELSATGFTVVDGEVDVALSRLQGSDLDDTTLDLGSEFGLRFRYTAIRPLANGLRLWIEPYYEYWEFGRSNTRPITSNGMATGGAVTEPRSESQRLGLAVGLAF